MLGALVVLAASIGLGAILALFAWFHLWVRRSEAGDRPSC